MQRVEMAKEKLAHANGGDLWLYLEQLYGLVNGEPGGVNYFNRSPEIFPMPFSSIFTPADCYHEHSVLVDFRQMAMRWSHGWRMFVIIFH